MRVSLVTNQDVLIASRSELACARRRTIALSGVANHLTSLRCPVANPPLTMQRYVPLQIFVAMLSTGFIRVQFFLTQLAAAV